MLIEKNVKHKAVVCPLCFIDELLVTLSTEIIIANNHKFTNLCKS